MTNKESTRYKSSRHEERSSKRFKSKLTPNSGAIDSTKLKGDHQSDYYFFECKSTSKKSFSLSVDLINDTKDKADKVSKYWILDVEFQGDHPDQVVSNVIVMDPGTFTQQLPLNRPEISVKDFVAELIKDYKSEDQRDFIKKLIKETKHLNYEEKSHLISLTKKPN